ncbi:hypothetical protein PT300_04580 [Enterobacteriaceae bacterium ESL0689]|nr:hypothetical protein [Enterobacteriaceae bacterium ESL0689]
MNTEIIIVTVKIALALFLVIGSMGYLFFTINDIDSSRREIKYEAILKKAIKSNQLKNEDIYLLATRWSVRKNKIAKILTYILNDFINEEKCSAESSTKIRDLIEWHNAHDPYSDLPENIQLHLKHLQQQTPDNHPTLLSLAKSLSDIYVSNQKEKKKDRMLAWGGLIIGIAGIICGFLF